MRKNLFIKFDSCNFLFSRQSTNGQVLLLNNDPRTVTGGSLPEADPALRPFTSVSLLYRGYTSHSH